MTIFNRMRKIFSKKSKPKSHADLVLAFKHENHEYYHYQKQTAMPLERYGKLQENLMWQSAGMSGDELGALIDIVEKNLEKMVAGDTGAFTTCGAAIREIQMRRDLVLHTELLYQFLGILYIRDDEDPFHYDEEIQQQKVETFKTMRKDFDFFRVPELTTANSWLDLSTEELNELWQKSIREQKRLAIMTEYLKSGKKSADSPKTTATD